MPKVNPLAKTRSGEEIEELAAPIIGEAADRMEEFEADSLGATVEEFLREHETRDEEVDRLVRRFIEYTLALRRRSA